MIQYRLPKRLTTGETGFAALIGMTLSPAMKALKRLHIERKLAASQRNVELNRRRIRNDTIAKRLTPEHAAVLEQQIQQWYDEIESEHTRQANLNIDLFQLDLQ